MTTFHRLKTKSKLQELTVQFMFPCNYYLITSYRSSKKVKVINVNKQLVSTSPVKPDAHQLSLSHHDAPASMDASLSDITSTSTPVTSSNKTSKHFIGLDMETQPSCYEYKVQDLANLSINYTATFEQLRYHCS